ncbi:MAG: glycosyltransferase family A protein [Mariprofundales bacterium]
MSQNPQSKNKQQPKVSVLTCVYNGAKYLPHAINSILNNSFANFEFIIVDDGSSDATPQILAKCAANDARIRVYTKNNTGLTNSLNIGLQMAKGEYIARLDADDLALSERLSTQVNYLDTHPEITLIGSNALLIDAEGCNIGKSSLGYIEHSQCIEQLLQMEAFVPHSSWMVRRKQMLEIGGYDVFFRKAQDYDFMLRLVHNNYKLAVLGIPLIALRKQEISISYDNNFTQYKLALTARVLHAEHEPENTKLFPVEKDKLFALVNSWVVSTAYDRLMLGQHHFTFAWYSLRQCAWRALLEHLKKACKADILFLFHRRYVAEIRRNALDHLIKYLKIQHKKSS